MPLAVAGVSIFVGPQGPPFQPEGACWPWTLACRQAWRAAWEHWLKRSTASPRSIMPSTSVRKTGRTMAVSTREPAGRRSRRRSLMAAGPFGAAGLADHAQHDGRAQGHVAGEARPVEQGAEG